MREAQPAKSADEECPDRPHAVLPPFEKRPVYTDGAVIELQFNCTDRSAWATLRGRAKGLVPATAA
jgi:hypothetical protein